VLRLLFSIIVVFGVVLNGYFAEAKSLKKGAMLWGQRWFNTIY